MPASCFQWWQLVCRARHDSAIVDMFHGQHVTMRTCPDCGHRSRRFEAYMYITAPIAGSDTTAHKFFAFYADGSEQHLQAVVKLPNGGSVGAFLEAAAPMVGVPVADAHKRLCLTVAGENRLDVARDPKLTVPTLPACASALVPLTITKLDMCCNRAEWATSCAFPCALTHTQRCERTCC
jgi:hypothetical protein